MSEALYKCVLLVDDNDDDNFIHKSFLRRSKWADVVHVCRGGRETLEIVPVLEPTPEVIFIDLNMPGMTGFQLLEELVKTGMDFTKICVVMVTSSLHPDDRESAEQNPLVAAYVNKPMNDAVLKELHGKLMG